MAWEKCRQPPSGHSPVHAFRWTSLSPGSVTMSKHLIPAGDGPGLLSLLARLRTKAEQVAGVPVGIVVIQEAGLDGFWVHRLLEANRIESHVVDAASIAVPRRRRRAKTDAIDGETLLRTLLAWKRGEPRVCAIVAHDAENFKYLWLAWISEGANESWCSPTGARPVRVRP
jgi:hypothetical protein